MDVTCLFKAHYKPKGRGMQPWLQAITGRVLKNKACITRDASGRRDGSNKHTGWERIPLVYRENRVSTGGLHTGLMFSCSEEGNKNSSSLSWKQTHLGIDQGGLERRERQDQDQDLNPTTHPEERLSQCLAVRLSWQLLRSGAGGMLSVWQSGSG